MNEVELEPVHRHCHISCFDQNCIGLHFNMYKLRVASILLSMKFHVRITKYLTIVGGG